MFIPAFFLRGFLDATAHGGLGDAVRRHRSFFATTGRVLAQMGRPKRQAAARHGPAKSRPPRIPQNAFANWPPNRDVLAENNSLSEKNGMTPGLRGVRHRLPGLPGRFRQPLETSDVAAGPFVQRKGSIAMSTKSQLCFLGDRGASASAFRRSRAWAASEISGARPRP
jgi:hypothetical protein